MERRDSETHAITMAVLSFINQHIKSANLSTLDDIVLNYVATVLESLASESGQEGFDVEDFCEMLSAYFPGFESISHDLVTEWICDLVENLRKEAEKGKPKREALAFESFLNEVEASGESGSSGRSKRNSESSDSSSSYYAGSGGKPSSSRASCKSPRTSETSDGGDMDAEFHNVVNGLQMCQIQMDENIHTLFEMFPTLEKAEAQNLLAMANGDLEKAVQAYLEQLDSGNEEASMNFRTGAPSNLTRIRSGQASGSGKTEAKQEKVLKDRIVARYGFIDQAEDSKEFRPPPLKTEPKKMVRYRESQVVSTKGERYSEVRCGADGGVIKNYIYKPPKPY